MSDMRSRVDSVRPPTRSLRSGGGLGAGVGKGECGIEKLEEKDDATRPVFPVREVDGDAIAHDVSEDALFPDDMLCAPCEMRSKRKLFLVYLMFTNLHLLNLQTTASPTFLFESGADTVSKVVDVNSLTSTTAVIRTLGPYRWCPSTIVLSATSVRLRPLRNLKPPAMERSRSWLPEIAAASRYLLMLFP